jgi:hypothetical protein
LARGTRPHFVQDIARPRLLLVVSTLRDSDGGGRVFGDTCMDSTRVTSSHLTCGCLKRARLTGPNLMGADQGAVRSQQKCAERPRQARAAGPRPRRTLGALAGGVKEVVTALLSQALSDGGRRKTEHEEPFLSILRVAPSTVDVGGQGAVKRG